MGKSVRNTEQPTVSNKEDVLSLLGGRSDTGGPGKPTPKKADTTQPQKIINSKDEVMDLLSGTVKKKDTDGASGATTSPSTSTSPEQAVVAYQNKSLTPQDVDILANTDQGKKMGLNLLSPEAKDIFATAHNGPKKSDLVNSVSKIIDASFPESKDFNQNKARWNIQQSVLHGDQTAIQNLKKGVIDGLQQKINQRQEELLSGAVGKAAWGTKEVITDNDPTIQQLRAQQQQTRQTIDDYGKMALVSGKDMEPWLKLDSEHPNILTSVAADKLGKMVEEKYGITATSKNKEYDRMRAGFDLITRSLQMDINEALVNGIPSKDPSILKKAQDKLTTLARYKDMYSKLDTEQFPDVGLDKTARYLGDLIAEKHPNKLIRTKEDVRQAATLANERNPGFLEKYGKFVDVAAEKQGEGTFIPRGGGAINEFIGGLTASSAKAASDLLKWRANVFGYDQDKEELAAKEASPGMKGTTQSGTEPTKIVFDKEGKAYRELPNENYGTLPWNNFFRFAGESIPGLLEFIGAEGATAAVAQITTGAKLTKAASQLTGLVGATYITSYNGNREFADANIDDNTSGGEAKKIIAANFMTLANAGIFHILNASPSKMVEAAISKNVMPEVVSLFEKNNWEKLSAKTMEGFIKENVLPRAKAVVSKFAESAAGGIKMGSAAVIDQKVKDMVGSLTNDKYTPSTVEDNARAFVSQALLMTGIGLPGMITTGVLPHSTKEALHQAGLYGPQYIDMIDARVQNGEMDMHQGAGIISMIKTMGEELSKAALQTNDDGTPLTTRQQRDIALAGFRARGAAAMEENGQIVKGGAGSAAEKEAKDIRKENNWQAIEETPVFKSITNYDGGEKVKSMDEIDPEKGYSWVDADGKKVDGDGATLLHHLETGDIYEKEKPDDKVEKGDQTPDAEGKDQESAENKDKAPVAYAEPVSEKGKAAIKEANERKKEIEDAGFNFLAQEDDGGPYNKKRQYAPDEVPIGMAGLRYEEHGKGLGTLGYILKGEEYLKQGRHLVSDAPYVPEARTDQAEGVWKKLVKLGLATETAPGHYRYGGERAKEKTADEIVKQAIKEGKIADNMAPHVEANPEQFLRDVADQALGFTRDSEGNRIKSDLPGAEDSAREQYGDKVVDAAKELYPEKNRMRSNSTVSRENIYDIDNMLKNDIKEHMQKMQPGASSGTRAKIVSELPQNLYESASKRVLSDAGGEKENSLPDAIKRVIKKGDFTEEALRNLSGQGLTDAPRRLLEAIKREMGMSDVPLEDSSGDNNSATATSLLGSYDRLISGGADPSDPEMERLKKRIDSISSQSKTETDGNVKKEQGGDGQEGSPDGQKSGQEESGQKEGVLTPEPGEGAEPPVGSAPVPENNNPVIGIRDSIVNADRVHRGLQPLVKEFVRSWGHNWEQLKDNIRRGFSPRKFIEDTAIKLAKNETAKRSEKKRITFSDYDFAALLFDRLDIQNNILRATDALNEAANKTGESADGEKTAAQDIINHYNQQLEQNEVVGRQMKSESGRALSAIQMMTRMNGELLRWGADIASYYNGEVPDKIKDFVAKIEKEYKDKNEQLRQHYEEQLKKAADEAFKAAKKSTPQSSGKKSIKTSGKELADKIRSLRPKNDGTAQSNLFGLPIAVYDTALVAIANAVEGGAKLVDAIQTALKDVTFDREEDRNAFMAHLQNAEDPTRPEAVQANLLEDLKSISKENNATGLTPEAVKPLKGLMTSYAKDGSVKTLDELVKKTTEAVKEFMPDVEEREIRDAFSGYGMKGDTEGKIKSDLTKMREQARAVSQYQDALERPPGETAAQQQKRLTKAAKYYETVQKYMREAGIDEPPPPTTPEGKKALALEQVKKRTQTIIDDLNRQILAGERKERNGVEPDQELDVLRAERKRLSDQLSEIEKAKLSPEEQIRRTEDALNRQIGNYERQIREGVDPLRPKEQRPSTRQIEELRERKKELKKQVDALRGETDPSQDPRQKALAKYNESLARQIGRLEEKIESKDYDPDKPPPQDFTRDTVSLALEARLKKLQSDFYSTKRASEVINKKGIQRVMSLAAATKRSFVLSRISTFGRLASAVAWNTIFEPTEAATGALGYAATKVGFGKKINEQAERYGVPSIRALATQVGAEGAAFKALTNPQTWKDFVSDAKNGYSELSLLYGHGNESIPKEARDTWMNIEHGLEAFGRGHGAVKGVAKRMEFTRAYMIRKKALRRKGQDVENPVIQQSIGAMAYQDAMRSILMEDNHVSKKYQEAIHALQQGGFGANVLALTLQEMMPIVKIPTNLVLNAGRATLGTPLAVGAIALRGLVDIMSKGNSQYGISKLSPSESDAILRNLRKGNVGMALMLGGFFAPNMFGASHYYKKGTDQPEGLEEGEVKFIGLTVPKWLADNPYLVTMKIGASLRNAFEYYTDQKGVEAPQASVRSFAETAVNTLKETPILGTPSEAIKWAEGYSGDWFLYNQVKSTLEPGLLQEIAEDTDNRDDWWKMIGGDRIKRKPQSVGQALETGVPGLREKVDEK